MVGRADPPAMMYVTKLLKKTTGEDNKRTEMYVFLRFCLPCPGDH